MSNWLGFLIILNFCANQKFVIPKQKILIQLIFFGQTSSKLAQKFKILINPRQLDISYYVWSLEAEIVRMQVLNYVSLDPIYVYSASTISIIHCTPNVFCYDWAECGRRPITNGPFTCRVSHIIVFISVI